MDFFDVTVEFGRTDSREFTASAEFGTPLPGASAGLGHTEVADSVSGQEIREGISNAVDQAVEAVGNAIDQMESADWPFRTDPDRN